MRATSCRHGLFVVLLVTPLLSQTELPAPFGFKDDRLGMNLTEFKGKHVNPGSWENEAQPMVGGTDPRVPPRGTGWKWKPDLACREVRATVTQCEYATKIAEISSLNVSSTFVQEKLAIIRVSVNSGVSLIHQALIDKLGRPLPVPVSGHSDPNLSALRWDNGVSAVEFEESCCGSRDWTKDVPEVVRGTYCGNDDGTDGTSVVWYVHKSLSNLALTELTAAVERVKAGAFAEQFNFDDALGMSFEEFKLKRHSPPCNETAKTVYVCDYFVTILGIKAFATAIFADNRLAVIHLYYLQQYSHWATVSGVSVPVDVKQKLITRFGQPEVVRGYGDTTLTADDRRALHWDDGVAITEYQENNCGSGNTYERITKLLQKRYCEKTESGDGTVSIWHIDKALSEVVIARWGEAEENTRKKARSDM